MTPEPHPFADMREHMKNLKSGGFSKLTELQQWQWHADVYAFRRVILDVPAHVHISPPDEDGKWFREDLVNLAETWYRRKYIEPRQRKMKARGDALEREGRDLVTKWVQSQGYSSVDAYCDQHGGDSLAAHRDYIKSPDFTADSQFRNAAE